LADGNVLHKYEGNRSVSISDEPFISLTPGKYLIRAKIFGSNIKTVLSFYSSEQLEMEILSKEKGKRIMKQYYISKVREMKFKLYKEPEYYFAEMWDDKYRKILAF
jgi:hypothetical protein